MSSENRRAAFRRARIAAAAVSSLMILGCGQFGDKLDTDKILKYTDAATGCLNTFGPEMEKYLDGRLTAKQWGDTWDCATGALDTFTDFVKGSVSDGYTREDMHGFVNAFLVTDRKIPRSLIDAVFSLKASIIGGKATILTYGEVNRFKTLLKVTRGVTLTLLPHLKNRAERPDRANLLALASAVSGEMDVLAGAFRAIPGKKAAFSQGQFESLIADLDENFGWGMGTDWIAPFMAGKIILLNGASGAFAGAEWPQLLEVGGHLGGAAVAGASANDDYMKGPNEKGEFLVGLAIEARGSLERALAQHGGRIPLEAFDSFVDAMPAKWLEPLNKCDKGVLKDTLRPIFNKLFRSKREGSVGPESLDLLYKKLEAWRVPQTHLETIFERYHLDPKGVHAKTFIDAAQDYLTSVPESEIDSVRRMITFASDYRPLFVGDDNQITFQETQTISVGHLGTLHWLNLVMGHLRDTYTTDPKGEFLERKDVTAVYADLGWFALEVGAQDPYVTNLDTRRFFEADNFVFGSNGDGRLDLFELTNYGAFLFSSGNLGKRVLDEVEPICMIPNGGLDRYKHPWMDLECFRKEYFGKYYRYWNRFPNMLSFLKTLDDAGRNEVFKKIEIAARDKGFTADPIGKLDTDNMAGVLHYIDAVFFRFDTGLDQRLDLDEVLAGYPKFKKLFAEYGKLPESQDFLLKSAFTYLVKFGHPPDQTTAGGLAHFVAWMAFKPFWSIDADRMAMFNVFSSLAGAAGGR